MGLYISTPDVFYMRFMKEGKVVRVARCITNQGMFLALYPSDKEGTFYTEAFHEVDDNSPRGEIKLDKIGDKIWKSLLAGKTIEKVVSGYDTIGLEGEYFLHKQGRNSPRKSHATFKISDLEEPSP